MTPRDVVERWVAAFNRADVEALAVLYAEGATNHQMPEAPVHGRGSIRAMFAAEFARASMVCIPVQLLEDGEWAALEWRDPQGMRGCGFFQVRDEEIVIQRGYWDKLSFLRSHRIEPVSEPGQSPDHDVGARRGTRAGANELGSE